MVLNFNKILLDKNIYPLRRFGQNFLNDKYILNRIIRESNLKKEDLVLEIGPGIGALTQKSAERSKRVIAVEKDKRLIKILEKNLENLNNIEIIEKDILKLNLEKVGLKKNKYKIIANLPFNISLIVIRKFLEEENHPKEMILIIQKEVAQRICQEKSNLAKLGVEFFAKAKILFNIPKKYFWPCPRVDAALIRIYDIHKNVPNLDRKLFFKIVKIGFSKPRKTILNNLSSGLELNKEYTKDWLKKAKIDLKKRPENLTLEDWIILTSNCKL